MIAEPLFNFDHHSSHVSHRSKQIPRREYGQRYGCLHAFDVELHVIDNQDGLGLQNGRLVQR